MRMKGLAIPPRLKRTSGWTTEHVLALRAIRDALARLGG